MPAVFVHGNPETSALWDALRAGLHRKDTVALSLPGFGRAKPTGFGATKDDYADWLVDELERLGEPVDLVGHDWGGILTVRVACTRSDLLRSWASDTLHTFDEGYDWHRFAKIWQTPGDGEEWVHATLAAPIEQRASAYESLGVPRDAASTVAAWMDSTLAESMLALYRSAINIGVEWGPGLEKVTAPGLRLHATEDPFSIDDLALRTAERVQARTVRLDGLGHWWMLQDPGRGARALEEFWITLATPHGNS